MGAAVAKKIDYIKSERERGIYLAEVRRLMAKHGGRILPEELVDEARDPRSPLHNYFEWNKDQAHLKFLIDQARSLIQQLKVTVTYSSGEQADIRAVISVPSPEERRRVYAPIEVVREREDYLTSIIGDATRSLAYWYGRLRAYSSLKDVTVLLDEAVRRLEKRLKPKTKPRSKILSRVLAKK